MNQTDGLHVIFGNGPVGLAVVEELLAHHQLVRVVTRSGARRSLPPTVEVVRGDATRPDDTRRVCVGASHVYQCTNPPDYHRWPEQFPPLQRGVLAGAAAAGAKLIVMENLYMYGPHGGAPMTEDMPLRGQGLRSTTRRRMTEELFAAHQAGRVRAASVRASDLFGPQVTESLVGDRFLGPLLAGQKVQLFANPDLPHSLSYIKDVGRAMVAVGADDAALGRAWHSPNAPASPCGSLPTSWGRRLAYSPASRLYPARSPGPCCPSSGWSRRRSGDWTRISTSSMSPTWWMIERTRRRLEAKPPRCPRRSARPWPGRGATSQRRHRIDLAANPRVTFAEVPFIDAY